MLQRLFSSLARTGVPWGMLLPAVLFVAVLGSAVFVRISQPPAVAPSVGATPVNPAIEDAWGIRVSHVGVTADGGMIDLRFQVTDPDKAFAMLNDSTKLPVMIAEDSKAVVSAAAQMSHRHTLNPGETYFLLYLNTNGVIRRGTPLTVVLGDLRLEHVSAL